MGFVEIKKMLEMYADGQLSVKPIPNHFDRIRLGEVMNAYRQQKARPKPEPPKEMTQEEKDLIVFSGIINCFEDYKQVKFIRDGYGYVYDFFFENKKLPLHTPEFRARIKNEAILRLEKEISEQGITLQVKEALNELKLNQKGVKAMSKKIVLSEYFDGLIENNIDIKTEMQ